MKKTFQPLVLGIAVMVVTAGPVLAHHSFAAIWDEKKEFTVTGSLTRVEWVNPHIYYYVEVTQGANKQQYSFEGMPPAMLRRLGFTKEVLTTQIGKTVTVQAYVAKDGTKTIGFGKTITFPDGKAVQIVPDVIGANGTGQ